MIKVLAKVGLFLVLPVLCWVTFVYLAGEIKLSDFAKRLVALLVAAFVLYRLSLDN